MYAACDGSGRRSPAPGGDAVEGSAASRPPVFAGRKLDLQSLYDCVASGGGFDAACSGKRWRDIARTIVSADAVDALRAAVDVAYPRAHPAFAGKYAVHVVRPCDGVYCYPGVVA